MSRLGYLVQLVILMALVYSCTAQQRICPRPNEHWTNCGSQCPRTCDDPQPGPCILSCRTDTCQCDDGYVRTDYGECVRPEEC